jgi:hypothetical protein
MSGQWDSDPEPAGSRGQPVPGDALFSATAMCAHRLKAAALPSELASTPTS